MKRGGSCFFPLPFYRLPSSWQQRPVRPLLSSFALLTPGAMPNVADELRAQRKGKYKSGIPNVSAMEETFREEGGNVCRRPLGTSSIRGRFRLLAPREWSL